MCLSLEATLNYRIICGHSVTGTDQHILAVYHSMKEHEGTLKDLTLESDSSDIYLLDARRHLRDEITVAVPILHVRTSAGVRTIN